MRIGLDFDNTIVSYDVLFHVVALEQGLIPANLPATKVAVRDYLRKQDKENLWTELQGYVYGARMLEAEAYPGAIPFIQRAKEAGHTVAIVSHKTKYSYLGPRYDLHFSARAWIERFLYQNGTPCISEENIFFEMTKADKITRIGQFACEVFVDDLPEILLAPNFPSTTRRFLFDPEEHHQQEGWRNVQLVSSWQALEKCLSL